MLTVKYRGRTYQVESVEDAAAKWSEFRDEALRSGLGPDDIGGHLLVRDGNTTVAKISWNGRIWPVAKPALAA